MNVRWKTALLITATFGISSCMTSTNELRSEVADRIASPAWMKERQIPTSPFLLTTFERMHERGEPANIYIEGDGLAWLSKTKRSLNPTPKNPVALHLASKDKAANLAYIARPCQYSKMVDHTQKCDEAYWASKRIAPEVIASYNEALDNIKERYDVTAFNLVGYSGGGAVAAILAAERKDVLSLRTVAGNLNHKLHSDIHAVSPLTGSLNAIDYAGALANMPQHHFVGGHDENVPVNIIKSYMAALGDDRCASYTVLHEATHEEGWVNPWPSLLVDKKPKCETPEPQAFEPISQPETVFVPRMSGSKK